MPITAPVCGLLVRTVMRVGRSSSRSGLPSSRMHGRSEVKPGLPTSSDTGRPRMRSAERFAETTTSLRSYTSMPSLAESTTARKRSSLSRSAFSAILRAVTSRIAPTMPPGKTAL